MNALARNQAVRITLLTICAIVVVTLASVALDERDRGDRTLLIADLAHGVLALALAGVLWRLRARASLVTCEVLYVVATVPFLIGTWLPQICDLEAGRLSEPLLAHHFLLLGIAVSAPSLRTGALMIGVFVVHALALGHVLAANAGASPTLAHEPWFTLLFGVIAGLLAFTRARRRDAEVRLLVAEQRARVLSQVSGVLLALRDRANTPLQTLEVAIALLEQDAAIADDPRLALMRRALARLIAIQHTLVAGELRSNDLAIPHELEDSVRELLAR